MAKAHPCALQSAEQQCGHKHAAAAVACRGGTIMRQRACACLRSTPNDRCGCAITALKAGHPLVGRSAHGVRHCGTAMAWRVRMCLASLLRMQPIRLQFFANLLVARVVCVACCMCYVGRNMLQVARFFADLLFTKVKFRAQCRTTATAEP